MTMVSSSNADPLANIPDELQPWVPWVLKDDPDLSCPIIYNQNQHYCAYPGFLTIDAGKTQARFEQQWNIYAESWIPLPGDNKHWPENVRVKQLSARINQEPQQVSQLSQPLNEVPSLINKVPQPVNQAFAQVGSRNGKPFMRLKKGLYHITGEFFWHQQPLSLSIPEDTGLINLTIDNKKVPLADFREDQLWLKSKASKAHQNNRLDLQVFRKITDAIPLNVTTEIKLEVSGQQREIILQGALLKDFMPAAINSRLPALLDKQGRLIIQARPGQWNVTISSFYPQQLTSIPLPAFNKPWPANEIWVLDQQPQLRHINVIDKKSIDARQTQLAENWKSYPAFYMQSGEHLGFNIVRRGDPEPEPDQLSLSKKMWLDFDGGGFTVNDIITGKLSRQWRLNAAADVQLGQVTLNRKPQYITEDDKQQQGIEVRHGNLNLSADSRINNDARVFSAGGWNIDFNSVNATLYLPAGWKLFSVSGANAKQTWLKQWTLLDLFVVLITAIAVYKLWGLQWGVIGLLALVLTWHQPWAPQFIWINLIVTIALFRALPEGRLSKVVRSYRFITTVVLVLIVLPFVVEQARTALYPQLEFHNVGINNNSSPVRHDQAIISKPARDVVKEGIEKSSRYAAESMAEKKSAASAYYASRQASKKMDSIDPDAMIQTGPGLPSWTLHQYQIQWDGPVSSDQLISVRLISPFLNSVLNILRIVLILLMVWKLLDIPFLKSLQSENSSKFSSGSASASKSTLANLLMGFFLSLLLGLSPATSEAAFPAKTMLDELHSELTKPSECLPECASIESILIDLSAQKLTMLLKVHALEDISMPLPVPLKQWTPSAFSIDEQPTSGMFRKDSMLWLQVSKGSHLIKISGRVDYLNQLQIAFPVKPYHVRLAVKDWSSEGMDQDNQKTSALSFTRITNASNAAKPSSPISEQNEIPVYAEITRTLNLGLNWHVNTRVRGLSGMAYPVILTVPLMSGESVISDNVKVEEHNAIVTLSHENHAVVWTSSLAISSQIRLKAIESRQMIERWTLNASPIWHIDYQGIAVIYHQRQGDLWQPEWRPWPGEQVLVNITKPKGVKGKTITIDSSTLTLIPGEQITAAQLEFNLRSSQGGEHTIHLPVDAELQSVSINNRSLPIRNTAEGLSLPVLPGNQKIKIEWNEPRGVSGIFHASKVSLGIDSVNNLLSVKPGYNRWILFTQGPAMGPAVLFWGIFGVILILSSGLGHIKGTPLNTLQWVLLWIGLSASAPWAAIIILGSILALKVRSEIDTQTMSTLKFNAFQLTLVILILLSLMLLIVSIKQGLLGTPDMQITGNGSSAYQLNWFSDRISEMTPDASFISVPVFIYRLMMLAWSIWLAFALIKWAQWGWAAFTQQEYWRHIVRKPRQKKKHGLSESKDENEKKEIQN